MLITHKLSMKCKIRKHSGRMPTIYASVASHQTSAPVKGACCEVLKWTGWTGLESWPPDVTSRGPGLRSYTGTCVEGGLCRGRACTGGGDGARALYSEVPWIILNAHMWPPVDKVTDWWTGTTENITFPQLCWQTAKIITMFEVMALADATYLQQPKCTPFMVRQPS